MKRQRRPNVSRLLSNYGMLAVLLVLAAMFSVLTVDRQAPSGAASGRQLAARLAETLQPDDGVLIVVRPSDEERQFAEALARRARSGRLPRGRRRRGRPGRRTPGAGPRRRDPAAAGRDCVQPDHRRLVRVRGSRPAVPRAGRRPARSAREHAVAQLPQARQPAQRGQPDRRDCDSGDWHDDGHHHRRDRPFGGQPDRPVGRRDHRA